MDSDGPGNLMGAVLISSTLIIRGFFTVCETVFADLADSGTHTPAENDSTRKKQLHSLLKKPLRLDTTFSIIRIATAALASFASFTCFHPALSEVFTRLTGYADKPVIPHLLSVLVISLCVTLLLSVFTDGIPSRISSFKGDTEKTALACTGIMRAAVIILSPFTAFSSFMIVHISSLFGIDKALEKEPVTEKEIMMMIDAGSENGVIEGNQREMISNVFEFHDLPVSDVMTHRTDITAAEKDSKISELVYLAINSGFSRIPVYKETIDRIIGIVCVKDLLCLVGNDSADTLSVSNFVRDTIYFPETGSCGDLFKKMTAEKTQLAVAVDEYGGTAGIVSMEDLLESIVGNIQDEYDNEADDITEISPGTYTISGTASPDRIMEKLGSPLPEDSDFDTMSGFLISLLGNIPEDGEMPSVTYGSIKFTALITEDMRIPRIKAEKPADNITETEIEQNEKKN